MIRVFNHEIKEGERAYFTVPAGELAHKAVVQLPVIVVAGKKRGRCCGSTARSTATS